MSLSRTQEITIVEMESYMATIYFYPMIDKANLVYDNGEEAKNINVGTFKKLLRDGMIAKLRSDKNDIGDVEVYDLSTKGSVFCNNFNIK